MNGIIDKVFEQWETQTISIAHPFNSDKQLQRMLHEITYKLKQELKSEIEKLDLTPQSKTYFECHKAKLLGDSKE